MCSRYTLKSKPKGIFGGRTVKSVQPVSPNYNIAITNEAPVITASEPGLIQPYHYGLVPWFSKTGKMERDSWNARDDRLMFSSLWKPLVANRNTCLILADGFYEWKEITPDNKQPYRFTLKHGEVFAFAGLYSWWRHPTNGQFYKSFSIVTTESNKMVSEIHTKKRMPFILPKELEEVWLSKDLPVTELLRLIAPYPDELMNRDMVSKAINAVSTQKKPNNHAGLIEPVNSL